MAFDLHRLDEGAIHAERVRRSVTLFSQAASPDHRFLAVGSSLGEVHVWK